MKFNIFHPVPPPPPPPVKEKEVTMDLRLVPYEGGVRVLCVDDKGNAVYRGNLVTFLTDGTIYFNEQVNETLGFRLEGIRGTIRESISKD